MDLSRPERCSTDMKITFVILTFLTAGLLATTASADGLPVVGVESGPEGLGDPDVRYEALPYEANTFVQRIERSPGRILESRVLRGRFEIPIVAYDGSAGGLSADGRTLVLIAPRPRFPRAKTTFAILDAMTLKLRRKLTLRGDYSFDALSPKGRWLYLIHYTSREDPLTYEVRVLDLRSGRLARAPIVDPRAPDEKMSGHPLTRAASADGRWAYTLYEGAEHPFVHALDTTRRDARCIDLHWLHGRKGLGELRFEIGGKGRALTLGRPGGDTVAVVDTKTFEAAPPKAAGAGSLPKAGLSVLGLLAAAAGLIYAVRARSRSAFS
jgi:hypothetical protein